MSNAQISMDTGFGGNGTAQIPQPSGAVVAINNGIAIVDAADVRIAINQLGWTVKQWQNWPAAEMVRMMPPLSGENQFIVQPIVLPHGLPPGADIGLVVQVPISVVGWAKRQGWQEVWPIKMLVNGSLPSPAIDYPGGNANFSVQITGGAPAVIGLFQSVDGGVTWTATGVTIAPPAGLIASAFYLGTGPLKLRAQVISGAPTGVSAVLVPGNFQVAY